MTNYFIKDNVLASYLNQFSVLYEYIDDQDYNLDSYDKIKFDYQSFLDNLNKQIKNDSISFDTVIFNSFISEYLDDIKTYAILGDEYQDIIPDFDKIKSFMKGLNSFINKSKNLQVNYLPNQLDILLDALISFYNEIDFNPAYLKRHLIISDNLFSYTYTKLRFKLSEQQKNDFNNKFKQAYKNILDTFTRQYGILDYSIAKHKLYNLSIRIESILEKYILIAEAYSFTGATKLIKDIPENTSANIIITSSSPNKEKKLSNTKIIENMDINNNEPSIEEQIEMQEIAELKTKFLFLHELGIIKHIETEYLKNNPHRTDKAIADIIATILQIDQAKQKESLRTYVRDLYKDTFYTSAQKAKVKKLMLALNLIN